MRRIDSRTPDDFPAESLGDKKAEFQIKLISTCLPYLKVKKIRRLNLDSALVFFICLRLIGGNLKSGLAPAAAFFFLHQK